MRDHALRARPSRVRGADRFDDIFEHGWRAQQTTHAGGQTCPRGSLGMAARIEFREVFIEAKYAPNRRTNLGLFLWCEPVAMVYTRSEEHTSELQSRGHLVCRLLL